VAPLERLKLDYMLSNFTGRASTAAGASASELVGAGGAHVWAQAGPNGVPPAVAAVPAAAPHAGRALHQLADSTRRILLEEGWQGLWRGNGVNLLRIVPFKTLNFFFFDVFRAQLTQKRLRRQRQKRRDRQRQSHSRELSQSPANPQIREGQQSVPLQAPGGSQARGAD